MKVDFSASLNGLDNKPLLESSDPEPVKLTACRACANALQAPDQGAAGADRVDRMRLAIRLMDPQQPVEISEKEKETILKAVEKAYPSPLIYFRVHELFTASAA
jgi:hypothetical protein